MNDDKPLILYADNSEQATTILARLTNLGAQIRLGNLEVGSYVIDGETVALRMSAQEFTEAITTGRLHHLIGKMKLNFVRCLMLIEGDVYSARVSIAREAIDGALAFLVAEQCVSVLYCRNPSATADLIYRLARQIQKSRGVTSTFQRVKVANDRQQALFTLESISGLGPVTALKALEKFGSVHSLVNASVEELTGIQGVGPKKAERIYASLRSSG